MKKSKFWLYMILGLLLVAAAVVIALTAFGGENGWTANTKLPQHGELSQLATEDGLIEQPGESQIPNTGLTPEAPGSDPESWLPVTDPVLPTESAPSGSTGNTGNAGNTGSTGNTGNTGSNQSTKPTEPPFISLPYEIPNTDLVLGRLDSYKGVFLEQGTDVQKDNVAMILLINEGVQAVEYGILTVTLEDGTVLEFEPTCLPAGGKMVVQENAGKPYPGGQIKQCVGETATLKDLPMSEGEVKVTENADSSLTVTNLTLRKLPAVRVFYKIYMAQEDGFVGGITYMAKVTDLAAGASVTVRPSHYLYGSCKVVMVRTYETAE